MVNAIFTPPMDGDDVNLPLALFMVARSSLVRFGWPVETPEEVVIDVFEAAAFAGVDAWNALMYDGALAPLESKLTSSASMLAAYEQQLLAPPETGLRERALVLIEALGHRDPIMARDAERLLHAAGEPKAAYRVEHGRRTIRARQPAAIEPGANVAGLVIAVAGGHPRLRKMIRRDLARVGVSDFREIPSAFEASRGGRAVAAKLGGADLTVVILRQISHSTSEQITAAAAKLGLPVVFSRSASIAGVRREVETFAAKRGEP